MIRNPDGRELKYFQLFWSGGVDNTRWKKVQSDPILFFTFFLSGNRLNGRKKPQRHSVFLELPKACYYLLCCYLMIHPDLTFILNVTDNLSFSPELHDPSTVALGIVNHFLLFVLSMMAFLKTVIDDELI